MTTNRLPFHGLRVRTPGTPQSLLQERKSSSSSRFPAHQDPCPSSPEHADDSVRFHLRVDSADLQILRLPFSVVLRCAAGSEVVRCTSKPLSARLMAIAAAIVVLPTPPFAHQHNQTVFTAGDIIDRDRERHILWFVFVAFCSGSNAISACSLSRPFNAGTPTMFSG